MKFDRAIRKPTPAPRPEKPLSPMAARHREFLRFLTSDDIGLTAYRVSVTIDRNHQYVKQALEKPWAPNDETVDAYVEKLFLNRNWLRHGRGKMIADVEALRRFAASVASKTRPKREDSD